MTIKPVNTFAMESSIVDQTQNSTHASDHESPVIHPRSTRICNKEDALERTHQIRSEISVITDRQLSTPTLIVHCISSRNRTHSAPTEHQNLTALASRYPSSGGRHRCDLVTTHRFNVVSPSSYICLDKLWATPILRSRSFAKSSPPPH